MLWICPEDKKQSLVTIAKKSGGSGWMCRRWLLTMAFVVAAAVSPPGAQGRDVSVGVYQNAPKVFINGSGQPAGIFIEIIEYIAQKEGWRLQYVPGTWGEGLERLKNGDISLMPDVAHSAEREKKFNFHTVPVLSDWFQVYARRDSQIQSIVDLAGKHIVVLEHSIQQAAFSQLADGFGFDMVLTTLPDYQSIFERVSKGEAHAAISNRFYGAMHAGKYNLQNTAVIFNPTRLFFAAPPEGDRDLMDAIDGHLIRLKKDPRSLYYQSLKRWTAETVAFDLPGWVKLLGVITGTALLVSLVGSLILKRQVNARTHELKQINRDMEKRIESRTAELAAAMEKARAADHLKSAFLATMSHELRTPLNSIIGFTGILLQGLAGDLNREQQKQLGMVQTSARHLLALINDVLDISKIEAGQLSLSFSRFDLRSAIEKAVDLILPQVEKKGLELTVQISEEIAEVTADQRRMEQVFINLLNNAVKFTEKGGIHVSCRVDGERYTLSIADTGIGMRPEEIPGLFQPFHQIDTGLSRKREGTGLGLSICRKLIMMMDGRIEVESHWGKGSTFTIYFPKHSGALS